MSLVYGRVIQMINDGPAVNHLARTAKVIQPHAEIRIFADAPAEVFFIHAVDRHEVVAPETHVAADNAALILVAAGNSVRISKRLESPGQSPGQQPEQRTAASGFKRFDPR